MEEGPSKPKIISPTWKIADTPNVQHATFARRSEQYINWSRRSIFSRFARIFLEDVTDFTYRAEVTLVFFFALLSPYPQRFDHVDLVPSISNNLSNGISTDTGLMLVVLDYK
jgi:hypothetical protein